MPVSPAEVEKYLKGVNYPSKKQDLVKYAEQQNAPRGVVDVLRKIPDETFNRPTDVAKAIGEREVSTAEVEKYLKGVNYPSKKQDLVKYAEQQNAPRGVIDVLQKIPDETFNRPTDVVKAIGEIK